MVRSYETSSGPSGSSLLRLIRESGDAHLGQTLVRLAQQAAVEHQAQRSEALPDGDDDQATPLRQLVERAKAQANQPQGEGVQS